MKVVDLFVALTGVHPRETHNMGDEFTGYGEIRVYEPVRKCRAEKARETCSGCEVKPCELATQNAVMNLPEIL